MKKQKKQPQVPNLPLWYVKINQNYFKNIRTQEVIHIDNIASHLPKEKTQTEVKPTWHKNYENY